MNYKKGVALLAAWIGLSLSLTTPVQAQVEWTTSLNSAAVPITLTQQYAAGAPDGSVYTMGAYSDSDGFRIRIRRTAQNGTEQWVRWTSALNIVSRTPLIVHPDGSATVSYSGNGGACFENFSGTGDRQFRQCLSPGDNAYATLAADGDVYLTSDNHRTLKKVSASGLVRWDRTDNNASYSPNFATGVNTSGDYFEVNNNRLRVWSALDGTRITDVAMVGLTSGGSLWADKAFARANNDVVVIRTVVTLSNAVTANVARYGAGGAVVWARDLVFPGAGYNDQMTVLAAENDGVYVVRTAYTDGDSQVAKLSSTGAIVWQKHFSRARRVIDSANGLLAIRSDTTASSSDSYIFPIAAADGSLGSPTIYSRTDAFAPSDWFSAVGGVIAAFQSNNPFAPYTSYPQALTATSIFLGGAPLNRWVTVATERPPISIAQIDSLMPRLARSSPSTWWARTQITPAGPVVADWTSFLPGTGVVKGRTAQSAIGSGSPITADSSQVIISSSSPRAKRVDPSGATTWQATSTINPTLYSQQPLQSVASDDATSYLAGSLVGRVSATGTIVFETETNRANPRYLAVDSANNTWTVAGFSSSDGYVSKVSPAGVLLWSVPVDAPSCSDGIMSARLAPTDEMLVATQSCNEGRLFKINASGQIAWQRIVSGTTLRPYVQLNALQLDAAGNIYAGGCALNTYSTANDVKAISLIASWTSAGTERWSAQSDLIGGASECITSIATDSSNNVYAATSSGDTTRSPVLWSFASAGVERWRHSGVLSSPFAASAELAFDSTDKLLVLGEAPPGSLGPREVTIRRINVATLGSSLRLQFLEVPAALIGYRALFPLRIGLRTAADAAVNATTPVAVVLALGNGTGNLVGSLACTIAIGASECTVADTRYDVVETRVTATAGADGFATVVSPSFGFTATTTTTTLSVATAAPYTAFSTVRVRAAVQGSPPPNQSLNGNLDGPRTSNGNYPTNCVGQSSNASALVASECDVLVSSTAFPLTAQFNSFDTRYTSSTATPLTLPVTKVTPTLQVTLDPDNTNVTGDRFKLRFTLKVGTLNVSQYADNTQWTATGGLCTNFAFSGSYWTCEITSAPVGSLSLSVTFTGSNDLLQVSAAAPAVTIAAGAVLRGSGLYNLETVCSPTPGVTCSVLQSNGYNWQCVGPVGMSGQVFFIPSTSVTPLFFPNSPLQFSNVSGSVTDSTYQPYAYIRSACSADVDGDGARLAMTDGVLILRRMLGLTGAALTSGATNACAPRSAAGITSAINLSGFDLDGDGQTRPETDGVLLLRAILGFRGNQLIANAVGAGATRTTAVDILGYLNNTCSFTLN